MQRVEHLSPHPRKDNRFGMPEIDWGKIKSKIIQGGLLLIGACTVGYAAWQSSAESKQPVLATESKSAAPFTLLLNNKSTDSTQPSEKPSSDSQKDLSIEDLLSINPTPDQIKMQCKDNEICYFPLYPFLGDNGEFGNFPDFPSKPTPNEKGQLVGVCNEDECGFPVQNKSSGEKGNYKCPRKPGAFLEQTLTNMGSGDDQCKDTTVHAPLDDNY